MTEVIVACGLNPDGPVFFKQEIFTFLGLRPSLYFFVLILFVQSLFQDSAFF